MLFAKETGCKLHFVHISSSEAIQRIVKARESGMDVTVESCPHYFALTAEDVEQIVPRASVNHRLDELEIKKSCGMNCWLVISTGLLLTTRLVRKN
ncbi:hypothetical protein [Oceanobacillus alkalisoli]|uniref:hypothetical protein n=1 Tax=Oceanobacillus alkalisoli TaxID=2925113 RepID=UPI002872E2C8|nr:hypothetical protein [Oceanobacillus alkalisoli]